VGMVVDSGENPDTEAESSMPRTHLFPGFTLLWFTTLKGYILENPINKWAGSDCGVL